jgi:MoxR-like ATPase
MRILSTTTGGQRPPLQLVLNDRQILNMQRLVACVPVSEYVIGYVARLVRATRPTDPSAPDFVKKMVDWGAGPRAGQSLIMGGKAFAAMEGRYAVSIDDIRRVAVPVLRHRIGCNFAAQAEGVDSVEIVRRLLRTVTEPELPKYAPTESPAPEVPVDGTLEPLIIEPTDRPASSSP